MPRSALRAVPSLLSGARVALIAPAGGLRGPSDVEEAIGNARALGWEPVVGKHALEKAGYFSGTDANRVADLNSALNDPRIDGVWCIRGGYGTMRILSDVDFAALTRRPKAVIGFSDATALHAAIQGSCKIISYHGPVARGDLTDFSRESLARAVVERTDSCGLAPNARTIRGGRAEGILAGGNLAVLTALCGTPYAPDLSGGILVLEDIREPTYRVDRMLRQLYLSGMLHEVRALVFGACTDCRDTTESGTRTLEELLSEMADLLSVPCMMDIPVGHIADQWTLPLGATAELDADARTLNVAVFEE